MRAQTQKGFGLVEIIIGAAILATTLLAVSFFFQRAVVISRSTGELVQASFLAEEGIEVLRFLRDEKWENLSSGITPGTNYYLSFSGSSWATTTTNVFVDGVFERKFSIENVNRDGNDDITTSGGTLDPNIKLITVSVSWFDRGATTTHTVSTYLTNIFGT